MTIFRVWAPNAGSVELSLTGRNLAMQPVNGGWWQLPVSETGPGTDYAFVINKGEPLPDPRSPFQPHGVHGSSQTIDHSSFEWKDAGWQAAPLASAVIYELHIGTFTPGGTFASAVDRLDYLRELGITHIQLMPVHQFSGDRGWGYDGVNLFAPHQSYGGPAGLKHLVNACHQRGLGVILDVVYNHLGPDGNVLDLFGPYFTERYTTPWGRAINFDGPGSDEVRRFIIDNALMWLRDYHLDGLRLDAVHAIKDESAVHILEELAAEVDRLEAVLGRHLVLIAESDLNDPRIIRKPEVGGYGLDAQWCGDFHHALHAFLTGEQNGYYRDFGDVSHLVDALQWGYVYQGQYSNFRQRRHGRPVSGLPGHRFLAYLQNHDQAGSRAAGERISQLLPTEVLKVAVALVLTSSFVPMLFMGEEWGASTPFQYFTDFPKEVVGKAVLDGRGSKMEAFGWNHEEVPDPQSEETFEQSRLDWSELKREPHNDFLDWTRKLIQLRYQNPFLINGNLDQIEIAFDEGERWLIIQRNRIIIACNLDETFLSIPYQEQTGEPQVLLSSNSEASYEDDNFYLPGNSVMIVQV